MKKNFHIIFFFGLYCLWFFRPDIFWNIFSFRLFYEAISAGMGFLTWAILVILVVGINLIFWGLIGLSRYISELFPGIIHKIKKGEEPPRSVNRLSPDEVAVIVPAHNEELVIKETIRSLLDIINRQHIFVVSDGSKDRTVEIVRELGVKVIDLKISRGKAGALEACIRHFDILNRYKAVLFVDADTRLKNDYLKYALPFMNDTRVVAVAGYAKTIWDPKKLSWGQMLYVLHRDRVYFFSQFLVKFGQTWRHTNVTHIVPGFASIYKTSALKEITMNPPGLVIEDFNMTFEVHHKKLGLIAHHPSVVANTQDPDNGRDYYRQVKRWHLGLWQTIRHHGFWPSKFWASWILMLIETVLGSIVFLLIPLIILISILPVPHYHLFLYFALIKNFILSYFSLLFIFWGVWVADYVMTAIVAIVQRRWQYLIFGIFFPFIRFFDAIAFIIAIPKAFLVRSSGRWVSPSRRRI